ncbi:Bystin [Musa troglodytarum]|uniref:Bystin n=1 Tax=Musa troglodytarum TaxID=320322 RepID=A0A9E7GUF6_9LILI|nr:Bystin [Musa troglodytarum]
MPGKKSKENSAPPPPPPQHRVALDDDDAILISSDLSSEILKEALNQQKEILRETEEENFTPLSAVVVDPSFALNNDAEDVDEFDGFSDTQRQYDGGEVEIGEEDEKLLAAFMSTKSRPQLTPVAIIVQRIKKKEAEVTSEQPLPKLDSSIIDLYKGLYSVGKLLSRYLTHPGHRIVGGCIVSNRTKKWVSKCNDIRKNKRLRFALYQALKRSVYKPAAFFKGVLLPLCQEHALFRNQLSLEALFKKYPFLPFIQRIVQLKNLVVGVACNLVISLVDKPLLLMHEFIIVHSAALMKLAELEYCGTTSYFIKPFLGKKYALPYRVLDAVVAHFMRFLEDTRIMPVIWHQSVLAFVQRSPNGGRLDAITRGDLPLILETAAVEPVLWLCESCSSLFASKAAAIGIHRNS